MFRIEFYQQYEYQKTLTVQGNFEVDAVDAVRLKS